jgi:hypothetical protein
MTKLNPSETAKPVEQDDTNDMPRPLGPQNENVAQQLDEEEAEFRAIRRDLAGVRGASASGIVSISVDRLPGKNEFFRTYPDFRPIVPIVAHEVAKEQQYFVVAPDMVEVLNNVGIAVADQALYFTVTSGGAYRICPVRQADADGEQHEYHRTREIGLIRGIDEWVRLYRDAPNNCYQVFTAPPERFGTPQFPDLTPAKIFRLAFRDKGRLIDSPEHALFKKWTARDTD